MHNGQRLIRALAFSFAFSGFMGQSAYADGSVSSTNMGYGAATIEEFRHFGSVIRQYNASGERFRIDSHCQSACTMFLSIRNVCVEPSATLLFHAGGDRGKGIINPKITQKMLSTYNGALRSYVTANHFMDTLDFHSISGSEIISRFGYRACR
jgi:hypothetical protein